MPDKNGKTKETLRLDLVGKSSDQYKEADIIVFNTGHWWTHDKTARGEFELSLYECEVSVRCLFDEFSYVE